MKKQKAVGEQTTCTLPANKSSEMKDFNYELWLKASISLETKTCISASHFKSFNKDNCSEFF